MNQPLRNGSFTRQFDGVGQGGIFPRFHMASIVDELKSRAAGYEIYKEVERVEFIYPGNPNTKPVFAVTEEHRQRWPREYEAFKKGEEMAVSGTPIDILPFLKPGMVRQLKALDIFTAEQLANLDDLAIQRIPQGGRRLKELASSYIDDAQRMALTTKTHMENDALRTEIAALRMEVENLRSSTAQQFAAEMERRNAPHPLATVVPASLDPMEAMRMGRAAPTEEPGIFDGLPTPPPKRKRGTTHGETQSGDAQ